MVSCGLKLILAADSHITGNSDTAAVKFQKSQPGTIPPNSALGLMLSTAPAVLYHLAPRCLTVSERTYPLDRNGLAVGRIRSHGGSSSIPQRLAGAGPQRSVPQRHAQFQSRRVRRHRLWRRRGDGELGARKVVFTSRQGGPASLATSLGRDAEAFSSREGDLFVRQSARQLGRNGPLQGTPRQGLGIDRAQGSFSSDRNAT